MNRALDATAFLARSEYRVAVLLALREDPLTREALEDTTGASSITLGRILADFERRRWVEDDGEGYRLTPVGEMVADALDAFLDDLDVAATLGEFAHLLPTTEYDFDLARLCNGTVVVADPSDPALTMRTAARWVADAGHVLLLAHSLSSIVLDAVAERVTAGQLTVECVYSQSGFAAMAGAPAVAEAFGTLLDHEGTTVHRYDGEIPHVLAVLDDCIWIRVDDRGHVRATLRVEYAVVRAWARETFECYRDAATVVEHAREVPALDHGTSVD